MGRRSCSAPRSCSSSPRRGRGTPWCARVVGLLRGPWGNYFTSEVLARELTLGDATAGDTGDFDSMSVDGEELWIGMQRLGQVGSRSRPGENGYSVSVRKLDERG